MKKILIAVIVLFLSVEIISQDIFPKRELRGAWIATIANIDWPLSNRESPQKQIEELKNILDKLKAAGINSVFFQIRTECDALYKSNFEPWSYWLTGEQGKAPDPFYDPLQAAIEEAHKRGMELHAWLNPLRAVKPFDKYKVSSNHITITHPEWILKFKDYKMLNPGLPEVRSYVAGIVGDIVRRYNVDGIHFDDYFYPYSPKIENEDRKSFLQYKNKFEDIDEWRRNNINQLIAQVHDTILAVSPNVKFGVSPFGIVENKYADTKGFESFKILYCDPIAWVKSRSVDYIVPQLYWEIGNKAADYSKLLLWWASIADGVQLYIGAYSSKLAAPDYKGGRDEIEKQVRLNRQIIRVDGTIFYSAKSITENYSHLADSLKEYFKHPSLIPQTNRKNSAAPPSPMNLNVSKEDGGIKIKWAGSSSNLNNDSVFSYVIYRFKSLQSMNLDEGSHIIQIVTGFEDSFIDSTASIINPQIVYAVTCVDSLGNESKPSVVIFQNAQSNVR